MGVSGDETPLYNPTEIAAALCASQRREERRCVTEHLNEYTVLTGIREKNYTWGQGGFLRR